MSVARPDLVEPLLSTRAWGTSGALAAVCLLHVRNACSLAAGELSVGLRVHGRLVPMPLVTEGRASFLQNIGVTHACARGGCKGP